MAVFKIPGTLLRFTNFQSEIQIEGNTLLEAIANLVSKHATLRDVIFDNAGTVRRSHRLKLNGEVLSHDQNPALKPNDAVEIITMIAGG